eukprot:gene5998-8260_t
MAIFGSIGTLKHESATIVFIAVMIFLVLVEGSLHLAEQACSKRGYRGLIKKLYREFMIMGFISFAIFIFSASSFFSKQSQWFLAFEFAHIVILFVGITFLIQSVLLIFLVSSRNKILLKHDNNSSEILLVEYIDLSREDGIMKWLFSYGPITIPIPELREKIEYKILQEFFIRKYNLPTEFKFANYMCKVLKNYVIALVEVRPISWLCLSVLTVFNYMRIKFVDVVYQAKICNAVYDNHHSSNAYSSTSSHNILIDETIPSFSNSDTNINDIIRYLASSSTSSSYSRNVCPEYTLRVTMIYVIVLCLYLFGVLIASEIYMRRLIDQVLEEEDDLERIEEAEGKYRATRRRTMTEGVLSPIISLESSKDSEPTSSKVVKNPNSVSAFFRPVDDESKPQPTERIRNSSVSLELENNYSQKARGRLTKRISNYGMRHLHSSRNIASDENDDSIPIEELESYLSVGKHSSATTAAVEQFGASYKRKYLYIKCLERLSNVEFDHLEHEARRMSVDYSDRPDLNNMKTTGGILPMWMTSSATEIRSKIPSVLRQSRNEVNNQSSDKFNEISVEQPVNKGRRQSFLQSVNWNMSTPNISLGQSTTNISQPNSPSRNVNFESHVKNNSIIFNQLEPLSPTGKRNSAQTTFPPTSNKRSSGGGDNTFNNLFGNYFSNNYQTVENSSQTRSQNFTRILSIRPPHHRRSTANSVRHLSNDDRKKSVQYFEIDSPEEKKKKESNDSNYLIDKIKIISNFLLKITFSMLSALLSRSSSQHKQPHDEEDAKIHAEFLSIFLFKKTGIYYFTVELGLLLQCLYIAIWITNLIEIALSSYRQVGWLVALSLPILINFFLLKHIIFNSCMLKSIVTLDSYIAGKICEEATEERNLKHKLRKKIKDAVKSLGFVDTQDMMDYLQDEFYELCDYYEEDETIAKLSTKQFKLLLHKIQIRVTEASVQNQFNVIDFDKDGFISWVSRF